MHAKRLLGLVGVIAAAAVLLTTAGAGASPAPRIDLSTRSGAINYLKSIGVDPKGVVIQRGLRNYAGPSCPGRRWSCTSSTRVFQLADTGGVNKYQCPGGAGSSSDPLTCGISQVNSTGNNVATCIEDDSTVPSSSETCTIFQQNVSGSNSASVTQKITQNLGSSQTAMETSTIDQQNGTGANTATVSQDVHQNANTVDNSGHQSQTASQSSCVDQHGVEASSDPCVDFDDSVLSSGADKSSVTQSVTQNGTAPSGASQTQDDSITGHVTQQTTGLATNQNTQNEHQNLGGGSDQSQSGPLACCTAQGNNTGDKYNITQMADQNASNPNAFQEDSLLGECATFGLCKVSQSAGEAGGVKKNSCTGTSCVVGINCTEGTCTPCTGFDCFPCTIECIGGPEFVNASYSTKPVVLAARRLLLRLLH